MRPASDFIYIQLSNSRIPNSMVSLYQFQDKNKSLLFARQTSLHQFLKFDSICVIVFPWRCTQVVVRGRTRNAIGPQGRVGSTPTISAQRRTQTFLSTCVFFVRSFLLFHNCFWHLKFVLILYLSKNTL